MNTLQLRGTFSRGLASVAFGTVINILCPPKRKHKTVVTRLIATASTTAHVVTCLREIDRTTVTTAVAASGTSITLAKNLGNAPIGPYGSASQIAADHLAANDWYVIELPDGTYFLDYVSAFSTSTLVLTPTGTVPTNGIAAGATVWMLGLAADLDPFDPVAGAFPGRNIKASTRVEFPTSAEADAPVFSSYLPYSPLLVQDNNATATGTIELVEGGWVRP